MAHTVRRSDTTVNHPGTSGQGPCFYWVCGLGIRQRRVQPRKHTQSRGWGGARVATRDHLRQQFEEVQPLGCSDHGQKGIRLYSVINQMENNHRLSISDPIRVAARDEKLFLREERLLDAQGIRQTRCKCRICIGSIRLVRKREECRRHVKELGRHPYHRGQTQVIVSTALGTSNLCTVCTNVFTEAQR